MNFTVAGVVTRHGLSAVKAKLVANRNANDSHEAFENKSAKRTVEVSLNAILFADPRGVDSRSLGCKVPPLWESWASKVLAMVGMIDQSLAQVLNRDGLFLIILNLRKNYLAKQRKSANIPPLFLENTQTIHNLSSHADL